MNAKSGDTSIFSAVLQLHDKRRWQAFTYSATLILTTGTALILDLRFHWSSERVLLYVLPSTVILLVLLPTLVVIFGRASAKDGRKDAPRIYTGSFVPPKPMTNPVRALIRQFVRATPMRLLCVTTVISLLDFAMLYAAAGREGVLRINDGIGVLNHYGLFVTILGNAVLPYAAKKYYDSVRSIESSKAVVKSGPIDKSLASLTAMIELRGRYGFFIYMLLIVGFLVWLMNLNIYLLGNPEIRFGLKVFDSPDHPVTFSVTRVHGFYTWLIIMPLVAHVVTFSSLQLRRAMGIATREGALRYDLLNPDGRGGFGFLRKAQVGFSVITGLVYVQILLYSLDRILRTVPEAVVSFGIVTIMLVSVNLTVFPDIYKQIKKLRFESLDRLKDKVYENDRLSFEILRYCYERRINWYLIISIAVQAVAILIAGIGLLRPRS